MISADCYLVKVLSVKAIAIWIHGKFLESTVEQNYKLGNETNLFGWAKV